MSSNSSVVPIGEEWVGQDHSPSSLPSEFNMSSIRVKVACSSAAIKGYGMILVFGWVSPREEAKSEVSSFVVLVQA